jgi:hypothetical protein
MAEIHMSPHASWTLVSLGLFFLYLLLYALLRAAGKDSRTDSITHRRFDRWKSIERAKEKEREYR